MKKFIFISIVSLLVSCSKEADVASYNLSREADSFNIQRRIVFYNGITGEYILEVTGLCSVGNDNTDKLMSITCKVGDSSYKKHFLGLSDNVTFFAEQVESVGVSKYRYKTVFRPTTIIPDMEVR